MYDPIKYVNAKAKGAASITRMDVYDDKGGVVEKGTTLLIAIPDGYDPETGNAKPPRETGLQRADLLARIKTADDAVTAARDALAKAQASRAAWEVILSDADKELAK